MNEQGITDVLSRMRKIAQDSSGWDTLYRDDASGEFWEVIYPQSYMHGGGPRELRRTSPDEAVSRYGISK